MPLGWGISKPPPKPCIQREYRLRSCADQIAIAHHRQPSHRRMKIHHDAPREISGRLRMLANSDRDGFQPTLRSRSQSGSLIGGQLQGFLRCSDLRWRWKSPLIKARSTLHVRLRSWPLKAALYRVERRLNQRVTWDAMSFGDGRFAGARPSHRTKFRLSGRPIASEFSIRPTCYGLIHGPSPTWFIIRSCCATTLLIRIGDGNIAMLRERPCA